MTAQATKERILAAALAEYSAYGIAGARVDRIAEVAGCNKNLIYVYFEDKDTLFATVLKLHLARIYEAVAFSPDDIPGWAIRVFDFAMANPVVMRLFAWAGLENSAGTAPARRDRIDESIMAMAVAEKRSGLPLRFPPRFRFIAALSLATAWTTSSWYAATVAATLESSPSVLRESIADAVRMVVEAKSTRKRKPRRPVRTRRTKRRGARK
jgi:AcrR family transcriptional regulator